LLPSLENIALRKRGAAFGSNEERIVTGRSWTAGNWNELGPDMFNDIKNFPMRVTPPERKKLAEVMGAVPTAEKTNALGDTVMILLEIFL